MYRWTPRYPWRRWCACRERRNRNPPPTGSSTWVWRKRGRLNDSISVSSATTALARPGVCEGEFRVGWRVGKRRNRVHLPLTKCVSKLKKTCPFAKSLSKVLVVLVFTRLVRSRTVGSKKREEIAIDSSIKLPGTFRAHHKLQIVGICNTRQELYRLEYVYLVHCNRLLS
jgi:hypothetical protein